MHNDNTADQPAKPSAGASESKDKHAQLELHPRKGRERPPSCQDEVQDATENKTVKEKALVQQFGKNYKHNTN